jgi:hypothetical protein
MRAAAQRGLVTWPRRRKTRSPGTARSRQLLHRYAFEAPRTVRSQLHMCRLVAVSVCRPFRFMDKGDGISGCSGCRCRNESQLSLPLWRRIGIESVFILSIYVLRRKETKDFVSVRKNVSEFAVDLQKRREQRISQHKTLSKAS